MTSTELRDDGTRETVFTLQHPTPAPAPGSFSWKLRLDPSEDPVVLGVHVADSDRPRVLLLQDHPDVEGARLQRWLGEAGSPWTTRTRVSTDRYRVATSHGAAVERARLEASMLAAFDVVVAHASALDRLSPEEHEVLDLALRRDGLGLLVLGEDPETPAPPSTAPPPSTPPADDRARGPSRAGPPTPRSPLVSPWLQPPSPATEVPAAPRETRIHLVPGIPLDAPVSVLAAPLVVPPGGQVLAEDPHGRPIVAWGSHGRGRSACSIVLDSWRWRQHGREDDYARFWASLLSAVARPMPATSGAWSMAAASLPVFVDQPITLLWSAAPDSPLPNAEVRARTAPNEPATPLNLNRSPSQPSRGRAAFWPVHPGWHTIRALPAGPTFDFYVQPSRALPGVRALREHDAAQRASGAAAEPRTIDPSPDPVTGSRPFARLTAFLFFVIGAAWLWRCTASRGPRPIA
jgi:hypothetical protein